MKLTPEQTLQKAKLETNLKEFYDKIIPAFVRNQVLNLEEQTMVLTTAYGIDRDGLFHDSLRTYLDNRDTAIANAPSPDQLSMFEHAAVS